jgi:predicted permease
VTLPRWSEAEKVVIENLVEVATQVAVLFVLMGAGAVLRMSGLVGDKAMTGMVNLLLYIVAPCVIIDSFQRPFDSAMLGSLGLALLAAVAVHVVMMVFAKVFVRNGEEDVRRPLVLAAVFSNAGFMGFPLEQAILGDEGVFFGVAYVIVFNVFMWSWGVSVMNGGRGDGKGEAWKMVVNPGTVSIAIGLPLFLFSVRLPEVLSAPVHHLANMNTPLAMTVVGYSLIGAKFGRVARIGAVYASSLLRLAVCPLLALAVLYPFAGRIDREMAVAIVIAASAPVGAMVAMFSVSFRRDVDVGVAIVSATTLASIATMPPFIALALSLFG